MSKIYYQAYDFRDYLIPSELSERFVYLNARIKSRLANGHLESAKGHEIIFNNEFKAFVITIKPNSIWQSKHNDLKIKIKTIQENFIFYEVAKPTNWLKKLFSVTPVYQLNKWTFLRLFEEYKPD